ncbi:glucosaminidase domain-containing protein [Shewanella oncorhynchi]|uniref:glucosaminidase domain-containing protein n=1 Tax=Shewanella TaxID=22 RepID=UPI000DEBDA37|nr:MULTISPECIES: glucosaminidase domain-containing protein [unclassified Shewanella]MCU7997500.1 glucosaminidase domain-containing protein [Shewanella sp. SM95]MCU8069115.1 glucosaminidase domain-containing protein [Shewanella sp. SM32]MCU8086440.1 glucosaminidase domain-containing protein [Shewanella sp. SM21]RBP78971.1 Bax protein [Shewanella putrefaciens]
MKTGRIGSFTLALAMVIVAIFALRVWIIPHSNDSSAIAPQFVSDVDPVTQVPDFSAISDITEKKKAFFDFLRPIVQQQNAIILMERGFINEMLALVDNGKSLSDTELAQINALFDKYQYPARNVDAKSLASLLKRVDIVPESMVLIQAANESGWGSSRFAREGFNFFGEWCFTSGCGIVPSSRGSGKSHEVKVFSSVDESVSSYMRNLNSNTAYALFRSIRADLRSQELEPTADQLIYGLVNYSERQEAYIDELLDMLRHNEKYLVNVDV